VNSSGDVFKNNIFVMERNEILCTCLDITSGEVEDAIVNKQLKSIQQVQDETEAGTVCGACVDDIYLLLEKINGEVSE
jgi:bacterioferritin-associated ferredoxin